MKNRKWLEGMEAHWEPCNDADYLNSRKLISELKKAWEREDIYKHAIFKINNSCCCIACECLACIACEAIKKVGSLNETRTRKV